MDRFRAWAPRAVAMVGFAAYALLAPAGPSWLDSSELAAAGFQLGSPRPTGFPLVCMVGKLASWLPVGELGFRFHLLSAACAALAMLWTARLVAGAANGTGRAAAGPSAAGVVGGLAAALLLGTTLTFARQATVTDVYAPTAALLAASFLLFDRVARGGDARVGLTLALVVGLGLGAHVSFRLLVPLPLAGLLWIRLRRGARWPLAAPLVALSVGAALHLYLPIRSASGHAAAVDRGHPRDIDRLVEHVGGQGIRDHAGQVMAADPETIVDHAFEFLGAIGDEMGVLGLVAALAGAVSLFIERRSRWLLVLLATVAAGDALGSAWIDPSEIAGGGNGVPLALACAALAGLGVAWLGHFAGGRAAAAAAAAAAAMLAVGPAMVTWPAVSPAAAEDSPRRRAEAALDSMAPRAVLSTGSDSLSALLLFLSTVEGLRPDTRLEEQIGPRAYRVSSSRSASARRW